MCLGGRVIGPALAGDIIRAYLAASFTGEDRHVRPVGMVELRVDSLAALLALREMLEENSAGDPMAVALLDRKSHQARDLLRLREVTLGGLGKAVAVQRHDTLVTLLGLRLVECDCQVAFAEKGE